MSPPELAFRRGDAVEIPALVRAEDGRAPRWPTRLELLDTGARLEVEFRCDDPDPWATLTERDAPLWTEEVAEIFLAPGGETPSCYFEIEVNPLGTIFDARVASPQGDRRSMSVDADWHCEGIAVDAGVDARGWRARLSMPWRSFPDGESTGIWRANLFRIERPRSAPVEHSAWSPTFVSPADFHRPGRFGILRRLG